MESKLIYLKKFYKSVKLYKQKEIKEINEIPTEWQKIFSLDLEQRIEKTIEMWEKVVKKEMKETILYLKENLVELDLISFDDLVTKEKRYAILYGIKKPNEKISYYAGESPCNNKKENDFEWFKVKTSINDFYTKLHDGFYYYASESMGLVPVRNLTYFKDYDWGILDELKEPLQINIEKTIGFFSSGMGGYVAIDFENDIPVLWFKDAQPKYNINFWSFIDAWIKIGIEI